MKKRLWIILAAVVLVAVVCVCAAYFHNRTFVNWKMQGVYLDADGTFRESVDVAVKGTIKEDSDGYYQLDLDFTFSENFPYTLTMPDPNWVSINGKNGDLPELLICTSSLGSGRCHFALSLEKECLIVLSSNAPSRYLIASCNADMDTQALLAYFHEFIESYSFDP